MLFNQHKIKKVDLINKKVPKLGRYAKLFKMLKKSSEIKE